MFFSFLWQRGKNWDAATADDLLDFEDWRRRSPRNVARIGGAKWNRELAALRRVVQVGRPAGTRHHQPGDRQNGPQPARRHGRSCEGSPIVQREVVDPVNVPAVA
ncbi:hypothetical protein [Amycolatopsis sp. lyj-84]|uniref:hypothetical protein n=1 Tax=Amycolatopsis sp. lyj-84 TaxID=2789284 RepID=UPI00397D7B49